MSKLEASLRQACISPVACLRAAWRAAQVDQVQDLPLRQAGGALQRLVDQAGDGLGHCCTRLLPACTERIQSLAAVSAACVMLGLTGCRATAHNLQG